MQDSSTPVEVFYSYAHKDESFRAELETHLSLLHRQGLIVGWHDRNISAGIEWTSEIDAHLQTAEIILLLVSSDFLASDYCYSIEMKRALERCKNGEAHVIPIILRPCDWKTSAFAHLQLLPRDGKPVTAWKNYDEAFVEIVEGIRKVVSEHLVSKQMVTTLADNRLKVFIGSGALELRDVRDFVAKSLDDRGINARVYETDDRPSRETTASSIDVIDEADIYVGLFWEQYKEAILQEYRYARSLQKPCFVYIRDKTLPREKNLEDFLKTEIYDIPQSANYDFFDDAIKLGEQVANDISTWLVRQYREMTAEIQQAHVSQAELTRLKSEVNHLQTLSRQSLQQGTAVDYLAQQLRAWFKTLNYSSENYEVRVDDHFEWIINVPKRRGYDRILIYGIEGEAKVHHVTALRKAVDTQKTDEGWIVAVRRIGQAARKVLEKKENRNLFCYTLDELLDENANFDVYFRWLEAEVKQRGIDKMYIPLACTKEEYDPVTKQKIGEGHYDERNGWIDGCIDRWQSDPSKEHISILGEFGTGKTWFALHYAWTAMQRYRDAKTRGIERPRLPLVIPLRDYAKAVSVESLFSEFFFRKHEIPLPNYSAFEQLNRMGKLLLIFDGFDEMAAKVDRQEMINNFWELARVVVPGAKVILTCRTEHFPEAKEGRALLNAELQASVAKLTGERPQFEVLDLSYFNDPQIRQVLSIRTKENSTVEIVMNNPQLLDLARRPVMTELILEALPDIESGKPVDLSRVYLYAVQRKMERDIREERTFTSLADKLYFLSELSWEMLSTNQMSLNYRLFPDRIRRLFGPVVYKAKDMDHWHFDMMGQTMLIRNAEGDYTPAHRSLLEFFVAYKLVAEMGLLAQDFTDLARLQSHLYGNVQPHNYTWSAYFERKVDNNNTIRLIPPLEDFLVEDMNKLVATVGRQPISKAILVLMQNMFVQNRQTVNMQLLEIIEMTREKPLEEVNCLGGNAATLLIRHDPFALMGQDLAQAKLTYTDFGNADLTNCNLQGANLQYSKFDDTTLENVDLCYGDLTHTEFTEIKGVRSIAFNPDGVTLASSGDDTRVHIWDIVQSNELHILRVFLDQEGGPKVRRVVFDTFGHFIAVLLDDRVQFWDIQNLSQTKVITSNELGLEKLETLCFNPAKPYEVAIGGYSGLVILDLSVSAHMIWKNVSLAPLASQYFLDGQHLVIVLADSSLAVLELSEQTIIYSEKIEGRTCIDACLSKDNNHLIIFWGPEENEHGIIKNGVVKIYEIHQHAISPVHSINQRQDLFFPSNRVDYLCENQLAVIAGVDDTVMIVDLKTGKPIKRLIGHKHITTVAVNPNTTLLATGSTDASIKFWDARAFVTRGDEPDINIMSYEKRVLTNISDEPSMWPEWWQQCKIDVPVGMIPNPYFGTCLSTIQQRLNCQRLLLIGAKGLDALIGTKTLGEWLEERGASLKAKTTINLDPSFVPSNLYDPIYCSLGHRNPMGSTFCNECGEPLPMRIMEPSSAMEFASVQTELMQTWYCSLHHENPINEIFCNECGEPFLAH